MRTGREYSIGRIKIQVLTFRTEYAFSDSRLCLSYCTLAIQSSKNRSYLIMSSTVMSYQGRLLDFFLCCLVCLLGESSPMRSRARIRYTILLGTFLSKIITAQHDSKGSFSLFQPTMQFYHRSCPKNFPQSFRNRLSAEIARKYGHRTGSLLQYSMNSDSR